MSINYLEKSRVLKSHLSLPLAKCDVSGKISWNAKFCLVSCLPSIPPSPNRNSCLIQSNLPSGDGALKGTMGAGNDGCGSRMLDVRVHELIIGI